MTDKEKYAIKIAIDTMDKYNSRYWNTRYGSLKTGVSVWYGEAISILSDMLSNADNMPGKWQLLIFLGQQTIKQFQESEH